MEVSSDYEELLRIFSRRRVKYLVIGAYAVIHYTEPKQTKDIEIWIKSDMSNAKKVFAALTEFGAPLSDIDEKLFTKKDMVYQLGVAPVRVDILMGLEGLDFDSCWRKGKKLNTEN